MTYKVVNCFTDSKDKNYVYNVGDQYPRVGGVKPSASRIEELSTKNNALATIFIEPIEEPKAEIQDEQPKEEKSYTKQMINRMATAELKSLAKELDLDENLSGKELKPLIAERLGL